jgi:hypothetical protein
MNGKLFFTSLYFGSMMIIISIFFYSAYLSPLYYITYIGILTSCMNHGFTHMVAKWLDRLIMLLSAIIYLYYRPLNNIIILFIIFMMIWMYFYSKRIIDKESRTYIHMTVHLLSAFLFILYHFCYV